VQTLARYRRGGAAEFLTFAAAAAGYAALHCEHIQIEETKLLPLAKIHLTAGDWAEIDAAFAGNADPLVGIETGAEYQELFRRLVDIAPPPLGVGPTC
jgi:hemerythrin-like domain-containing protein